MMQHCDLSQTHADVGIRVAKELQHGIRWVIPELLYKQRLLPVTDLWTALLCSPMKPGLTAFTFILRFTLYLQSCLPCLDNSCYWSLWLYWSQACL